MKKLVKNIILGVIVASVALTVSCSGFEEMNIDPNRVLYGSAPPTKLLQNIIYSGHTNVFRHSYNINSELINYAVYYNVSNNAHCYEIRAADVVTPWRNLYQWASSAHHMYKTAIDYEDPNCMAIALTLKIYIMEVVTSMYGDVPYSEALRWDEVPQKPKFDPQEDIYKLMIDELDYANTLYVTSRSLDYPARDLLFGGSIVRWKRFTNSLRLRLLMRASKCTEIDVPALMQEMVNDPTTYPVFTSNADAPILRYSGVSPFFNPFGALGSYDAMHGNTRAGKVLCDLMNPPADPRRSYYFTARGGQYLGMAAGQDGDYYAIARNEACNYNTDLSTNTSPTTLMNYAEVLFIKAEAAFRGFITGSAESYYNDAVTASVRQWTGNESFNVSSFLDHESVKYNNTLLRIIEQKYVSQYLCGLEAWCDYRRTGLPEMPIGPIMINFNENGVATLPTRLYYPSTTSSTNTENYKAAVERMGGKDDMLTKVWFARGTRY